jgi:hypothetical protein
LFGGFGEGWLGGKVWLVLTIQTALSGFHYSRMVIFAEIECRIVAKRDAHLRTTIHLFFVSQARSSGLGPSELSSSSSTPFNHDERALTDKITSLLVKIYP